jgi:hypothetical protein
MRELAAQFVTEQQIVKRNQRDPVRQSDDADEENPRDRAADEVRHQRRAGGFRSRLAHCARNQRGHDRGQRGQPVESVVEHGERSGPAEAVDADDGNQIAREHELCVGSRRQLAQVFAGGFGISTIN